MQFVNFFHCALLAISLLCLALWYYSRKARFWQRYGVNGPRALPIFGNVIDNFFTPIPILELNRYRKYGRIYGLMEFTKPVLTIGEPELIKQISVKDFHLFPNRLNRLPGDPFFSKVLLFLQNEDWKRVRCTLNPAFTSAKMRRMFTLMDGCVDNTLQNIDQLADKSGEVNLKQFSTAQSFDTIIRCTLGVETNAHKDPNNKFMVNLERFLDFSSWRFIAVLLIPKTLQSLLGIQQTPDDVLSFFRDSMSFILKERKDKNLKGNDLLQLLMDAELDNNEATQQKEESKDDDQYFEESIQSIDNAIIFKNSKPGCKKLEFEEIVAQAVLLLLGGYHTTAQLIQYCIYVLACYADIQDNMYKELKEKYGENSEAKIDYESLKSLKYLDAFVSETLRYYPPVVSYDLVASRDYELSELGITIQKGVRINFPAYAIHHDKEFYPDPESFKPERFLPENRGNIKPCTFLPFGSGPRHCIGLRFAVLEAKLCLAKIVPKFKFFATSKTAKPPKFISKTDMSQCEPLIVGVERRSR